MRMTEDMLQQLPTAFDLAVRGARSLRFAPKGDTQKGKVRAKGKSTHSRKNTKVKAKVVDTGEPVAQAEDQGTGGETGIPVGATTNDERII